MQAISRCDIACIIKHEARNKFFVPVFPDRRNFFMQEISASGISGITAKAPCEAVLMGERHVRIEISDFVMRTFVLLKRAEDFA